MNLQQTSTETAKIWTESELYSTIYLWPALPETVHWNTQIILFLKHKKSRKNVPWATFTNFKHSNLWLDLQRHTSLNEKSVTV